MKRLVLKLTTAFALFFALNLAIASSNDFEPTTAELRSQIIKFIEKPDLSSSDFKVEESATLLFTVNNSNELVVIDVVTESAFVEDYLKRKLNYKKVEVSNNPKRITYSMKIVFRNGDA